MRLNPPTPQARGVPIVRCLSRQAKTSWQSFYADIVWMSYRLVLQYTGSVLWYRSYLPAGGKGPERSVLSITADNTRGRFRRRGGSTGPAGGASIIRIPYYLRRRTAQKIHPYLVAECDVSCRIRYPVPPRNMLVVIFFRPIYVNYYFVYICTG